MKVADATYEGPMRSFRYRCHSGSEFFCKRGRSFSLDSLEDAKELDSRTVFEVDWTIHGELLKRTGGELDSAVEAVEDFGYRQKQKLAKSLGINAGQSDDELEEELKEQVEQLQFTAENQ